MGKVVVNPSVTKGYFQVADTVFALAMIAGIKGSSSIFGLIFSLVRSTAATDLAISKRHLHDFFACVASTLKSLGLNPDKLEGDIGLTAVLQHHSRRLDYHPLIHVVVPGGAINQKRKQWKKLTGKYLFNEFALVKVFRARFIDALNQKNFSRPYNMAEKWVANVRHVGQGMSALKYLSRYLYRGVISEKNIIANKNGQVTFKYKNSDTQKTETR
ncbi:hypothetical protein MNBD_GAMMA07-1036, partial [hydrothermal vent metagenome]